jgi:hypothetical protein
MKAKKSPEKTPASEVPKRRPGRKPGVPNKISGTVKENVIAVFHRIGGNHALAEWAEENRTEFYRLYAKLLPTETMITGNITIVQKQY